MPHTIMRSPLFARLWMFAWSTVLVSALACGSDQAAGPGEPVDVAADSIAPADTVAAIDSLAPVDSLNSDSLLSTDSLVTANSLFGSIGVPYGPMNLMNSYTTFAWGPAPFTSSKNGNTGPGGVVRQIAAARAIRHRLMLSLTDGYRDHYMTNGKFDLAKWKRAMDAYRTSEIKTAVARGVADGIILGNQIINEPNLSAWGMAISKSLLDQMCSYVKSIFPTLPAGPLVVHWWRPTERYRVCDFIIDQYGWTQGSMGPGTAGGKGNVTLWRDAALAQAKKEGITIAFSMNLLDGGIPSSTCPLSTTGGKGTYGDRCRMTATQVRDWGRALGPSSCALLMWKYDATFMSKSANVQAFKDVAATLATKPNRSCRRTA